MGKLGCVAIVKNEERHIAEWLAWQFLLGFDTVFLLDNNSTERTVRVARSLAPQHDIRVSDWPLASPDYQIRAYDFARGLLADEFEWLAFFDTDEFLVLDEGLDLRTCLAARPEAGVGVAWSIFGSSGHLEMPDGLVTAEFVRRSLPSFPPNRHIKSIIRPKRTGACLSPHVFDVQGGYVDLVGRQLRHTRPGLLDEDPDYAGGKLHHYFTRSRSHFEEKRRRGYPDVTRQAEDFAAYDRNEVLDESASRAAPRVAALLSRIERPRRKTCAVVLLVKDEMNDVACWLAWYHLLGFDACIVFDDDSTDGTWEMLHLAARVQDIRLARAKGPKGAYHEFRQTVSYEFALREYAEEFEWLAFFDADEYLALMHDPSIKSFLARFPDADQVCVNWCNYGSSGHYLKPKRLPVEAYTWHRRAEQQVNRHVKSIVRPDRVGSRWICVHCFDVAPERSVLANGKPVSWSADLGVIDTDADYSVAKLMHYQCRSMEHFIERLKRRPELQNGGRIWEAYDLNEVEDTRPLRMAGAIRAHLAAIARGRSVSPVADLIFDIGMAEGNDTAFYLAKGFRVVGVEADVQAYYALMERFAGAIEAGRLFIHNMAAGARNGEIVEFFHHDEHQGLSGLSRDRAEFSTGYKSYHVLTIDWAALTEKHGVPYYMKIDIEGHEAAFLAGAVGRFPLPNYLSAECNTLAPVEKLYELGYRWFKLVDQLPPGGLRLPGAQAEGNQILWPDFSFASGPFGRDLPGEWVDFETFQTQWEAAQPEYARTWFDCHAWMP